MAKTKLILSDTEAAAYVEYLTGFSNMSTVSQVFIGLGNMSNGVFTEITPNADNNYARVLIKQTSGSYPDLLTQSGRTVVNKEQIVFNKVLKTAYTSNAIGLYRQASGGSPYAYGTLDPVLTASVGSLPMFERQQLQLVIPDGTEND